MAPAFRSATGNRRGGRSQERRRVRRGEGIVGVPAAELGPGSRDRRVRTLSARRHRRSPIRFAVLLSRTPRRGSGAWSPAPVLPCDSIAQSQICPAGTSPLGPHGAYPSHRHLAISLDARGLPVGLFTVNRGVTGGHWFDARTTMSFVERFGLGEIAEHENSCRWLTEFVQQYRPMIESLLIKRDHRLARRAHSELALGDQRLEVLSKESLDWAADLDALELEAHRRSLWSKDI